jgi:hypothetical protein
VRVSRGRGTGLEFRIRRRLSPEENVAQAGRFFPEIEGLSNPPDPAPEDLYPPRQKKKRGWFVDVSDILFDGPTDMWFGRLRFLGQGRAGGGVVLQVRESLEITGTILDLDDGSIILDGDELAQDLDIEFSAALEPFVPKKIGAMDLLRKYKGSFALKNGTIGDIAAFNKFIPAEDGMKILSGTGSVHMDFSVPSAQEAEGSVEISFEGIKLLSYDQEISGEFDLQARLLHGDLVEGLFEIGETTFSLDRMRLPDPKRDRQEEREAIQEAKEEYRQQKKGEKQARKEEKKRERAARRAAREKGEEPPPEGQDVPMEATPEAASEPPAEEKPEVQTETSTETAPGGDETVSAGRKEPGEDAKEEDEGWWAHFKVDGGTVDLGYPSTVDTTVEFQIKDTRPLLYLFFQKEVEGEEKPKTPGWIKMVPNIKNMDGEASLDMGPDVTIVDDVLIAADKMDMMARLKIEKDHKMVGQVYVRYGIFHIGLNMTEEKRKIRLSKPRVWFIEQPEFDTTKSQTPSPDREGLTHGMESTD